MEDIIHHVFSVLKTAVLYYENFKRTALKYLNPFTAQFDLVDILLIWTIIVYVAIRFYQAIHFMSKNGKRLKAP